MGEAQAGGTPACGLAEEHGIEGRSSWGIAHVAESRHFGRHALGEPVVDCAFADVQLPGGLGLAHPLEITVDDCEAESFGQSGDFFVECRQQIIGRGWPTLFHCVFHLPHLPFECYRSPGRCDIGLNGNPVCDPVQPAAEGIPTADGVFPA